MNVDSDQLVLLQQELEKVKKERDSLATSLDREAERVSSQLLRRVANLQKEKEKIVRHFEEDEESISNSLSKQLLQLKREKIALENALEAEEEKITNQLLARIRNLQLANDALVRQWTEHCTVCAAAAAQPPLPSVAAELVDRTSDTSSVLD